MFLAAGALAGFVTAGGASAVLVLAPLLLTFGVCNAYEAVGLSLAVEFVLYLFLFCIKGRSARPEWKTVIVGTVPLIVGTVGGSYLSKWIPETIFGWILFLVSLTGGIFLFVAGKNIFGKQEVSEAGKFHPWRYVFWMVLAGLLNGAFGLGSALVALMVLYGTKTFFAQMELDTGMILIGISAMTGYLAHSALGSVKLFEVVLCAAFTLAAFRLAGVLMNTKTNVYTKLVGAFLLLAMVILMPLYLFA